MAPLATAKKFLYLLLTGGLSKTFLDHLSLLRSTRSRKSLKLLVRVQKSPEMSRKVFQKKSKRKLQTMTKIKCCPKNRGKMIRNRRLKRQPKYQNTAAAQKILIREATASRSKRWSGRRSPQYTRTSTKRRRRRAATRTRTSTRSRRGPERSRKRSRRKRKKNRKSRKGQILKVGVWRQQNRKQKFQSRKLWRKFRKRETSFTRLTPPTIICSNRKVLTTASRSRRKVERVLRTRKSSPSSTRSGPSTNASTVSLVRKSKRVPNRVRWKISKSFRLNRAGMTTLTTTLATSKTTLKGRKGMRVTTASRTVMRTVTLQLNRNSKMSLKKVRKSRKRRKKFRKNFRKFPKKVMTIEYLRKSYPKSLK